MVVVSAAATPVGYTLQNEADGLADHRAVLTGYLNLAQEMQQRLASDKEIAFNAEIARTFRVIEKGAAEFISQIDVMQKILMREGGVQGVVSVNNNTHGSVKGLIEKTSAGEIPKMAKNIYEAYFVYVGVLQQYFKN